MLIIVKCSNDLFFSAPNTCIPNLRRIRHPRPMANSAANEGFPEIQEEIKDVVINNVWRDNLEAEFTRIRNLIKDYPFIAFDTEFPGVVATPMGAFKNKNEFVYNQIMSNVNMLKPIQVGFCLMNEKGELPPRKDVWQFNLHFSLGEDIFAVQSIDLLKAAGIDFTKHRVGVPGSGIP